MDRPNVPRLQYHSKWLLLVGLLLAACSSPPRPDGDAIINKAIAKAGGEKLGHSRISFTFRGTRYQVQRQGAQYSYQRSFSDSTGAKIVDEMTNTGFTRTKNGQAVKLSADKKKAYSNSVNSVIYFGLLPYKLNDAAVHKKYLGEVTIKGEPYYKISVGFDKKGGGKDYRDSFMYWIHRHDYTMDYMAYRFHVNEGGTRFREVKNVRTIKGIRFQDYNNLGGPDLQRPLAKYDTYFKADTLDKVSEINLKDINVTILDAE